MGSGWNWYICPSYLKTHPSPWFSAACGAAIVHRNHFFHLYQQNKSSESQVKFRQAINHCKRVLEAAKLAYANKTKESITSQKLGSQDFWQIANIVLNKGKSAIPPLEVCFSVSDKTKLCAKNLTKNSNLGDSGVSLPIFPSRTNLKLNNIYITPRMVKKIIANLDSSSGGFEELSFWTFIHTNSTLQCVSQRVLFSRLLEGLIGGLNIWESWGKVFC